jgi:hypothetical protein
MCNENYSDWLVSVLDRTRNKTTSFRIFFQDFANQTKKGASKLSHGFHTEMFKKIIKDTFAKRVILGTFQYVTRANTLDAPFFLNLEKKFETTWFDFPKPKRTSLNNFQYAS